MKKFITKMSLLAGISAMCMFVACASDDEIVSLTPLPSTDEEIEASVYMMNTIATNSNKIVNEAVTTGGMIDPKALAQQIAELDNVVEAKSNDDGTAIVIKQADGLYLNILLSADKRLYKETTATEKASITTKDTRQTSINGSAETRSNYNSGSVNMPQGKKALILAPFQFSFNAPLSTFSSSLKEAGFSVDIYENYSAGLDKFRGDFLTDYDALIISTHGNAGITTMNGAVGDVFATSTKWNLETAKKILKSSDDYKEHIAIGCIAISDDMYVNVSEQYIRETANGKKFNNSFVYAAACEGLKNTGSTSMVKAFKDMGAGGYVGYKKTVAAPLDDEMTSHVLNYLSSGFSLKESVYTVKKNGSLRNFLYLVLGNLAGDDPYSQLDILDYRENKQPFYLINPIPHDLRSSVNGGEVTLSWTSNLKYVDNTTAIEPTRIYYDVYIDGKKAITDYQTESKSVSVIYYPKDTKEHEWYVVAKQAGRKLIEDNTFTSEKAKFPNGDDDEDPGDAIPSELIGLWKMNSALIYDNEDNVIGGSSYDFHYKFKSDGTYTKIYNYDVTGYGIYKIKGNIISMKDEYAVYTNELQFTISGDTLKCRVENGKDSYIIYTFTREESSIIYD